MKTLSEYQKEVEKIEKEFNFKWPLYVRFIHLVEEVGELGEAITVKNGDRKSGSGEKGLADHADLEEEFGDTLFSLFDLANKLQIDLPLALEKTFKRYHKKLEGENLNKYAD